MAENLALFLRFYYRPGKAASDALDNASFAFSLCVTGLVMLLWNFGAVRLAAETPPPAMVRAMESISYPGGLLGVFAIFAVMAPVSLAAIAIWDGLGSPGIVLRREYLSFLVCGLLAWSAAHLPFALVQMFLSFSGVFVPTQFFSLAAQLIFLGWFVVCLRTALGTGTGRAAVGTAVGWIAALLAVSLWPIVGNLSYFLLSPWVLYMLYRAYSPDVRSLGDTMNSRRNFRRQLEASMLNPRDADAHYQLGLIYQQRRQYEEAAASFGRAVAIHPGEADAHLQLGRVLRAQGKSEEALRHFETALKEDRNVGRYEGWRELGAALLDLGRVQEAETALERYTNQREYDPEGLYYYGCALKSLGKNEPAHRAFQQAIDAVQTAPSYRRGQLRRWASEAKSQLRNL